MKNDATANLESRPAGPGLPTIRGYAAPIVSGRSRPECQRLVAVEGAEMLKVLFISFSYFSIILKGNLYAANVSVIAKGNTLIESAISRAPENSKHG
jgi:hypothetical protein